MWNSPYILLNSFYISDNIFDEKTEKIRKISKQQYCFTVFKAIFLTTQIKYTLKIYQIDFINYKAES